MDFCRELGWRRLLLLARAATPCIIGFVREQGAWHGAVAEVRKPAFPPGLAVLWAQQCCADGRMAGAVVFVIEAGQQYFEWLKSRMLD